MAIVITLILLVNLPTLFALKVGNYDDLKVRVFEKAFVAKEYHGIKVPTYKIDDMAGVGRTFDGIGGLSGGGATSRLLSGYQIEARNEILDYLFLPGFGASLHILKVEIGGDAQSTEGTEHTHMRSATDENYYRGYEWWLMKEAKHRNPDIKLVGLPWGWPGWIGQGGMWPYENTTVTATYILKWIQGAKEYHDLTIDYVGIWNELSYDVGYIKELRKVLDSNGFHHVKIIAVDGSFEGISNDILNDPELAKAVGVIGAHYPGTFSTAKAVETNKPLWSSEDYSTLNDEIGAGCWARILNQNHVNGNMTSTIAWNLIASYYDNLPFKRCSLMTANEPWSGHYDLADPLWITAHTTQFTMPGWSYLHTVGHLAHGGSYVALTDGKGSLTIVVETMSHNRSVCIRPPLPEYTVESQNASFLIGGSFKGKINKLRFWMSNLGSSSTREQIFVDKGVITADSQGMFHLYLPPDVVVTLSTVNTAKKGSYPAPSPSKPFPIPYHENFDPNGFSEANNFADQAGAFETHYNPGGGEHKWTLRQMVTQRPVSWCDDPNLAISVIGDYSWSTINATVSVKVEGTYAVFLALRSVRRKMLRVVNHLLLANYVTIYTLLAYMLQRVNKGGCATRTTSGLFFWLRIDGARIISTDVGKEHIIGAGYTDEEYGKLDAHEWNTIALSIDKNNLMTAYLNGAVVWRRNMQESDGIPANGFVAIGTNDFGVAQFDDFSVHPLH